MALRNYPEKRTKGVSRRRYAGRGKRDKRLIKIISAVLYLICAVLFVIYAFMLGIKFFYNAEDSLNTSSFTECAQETGAAVEGGENGRQTGNAGKYGEGRNGENTLEEGIGNAPGGHPGNNSGEYSVNCAQGSADNNIIGKIKNSIKNRKDAKDSKNCDSAEKRVISGNSAGSDLDVETHNINPPKLKDAALLFAGNMYLDSYALSAYDESGSITGVLSPAVRELINNADIFMANQIFCISDRGEAAEDKEYTYRIPTGRINVLKETGTDIVSLANSHALDYGYEALSDTLSALDKAGISHTGAGEDFEEASKAVIKNINGMKTAFIAASRRVPEAKWGASKNAPGVFLAYDANLEKYLEKIRELDKSCDFVIAYIYWDTEEVRRHEDVNSGGPEAEEKSGPPDYMKLLMRKTAEAGADLVIGTGDGKIEEIEYYRGVPIVYSLGDFINGSKIPSSRILEVTTDGQANKIQLRFYPIKAGMGYTKVTG